MRRGDRPCLSVRAHLADTRVFELGVDRSRFWNNIHFSRFPLFGKLSCRAFGKPLKVPSEVNMQCFFRLGWDHFNASSKRSVEPRLSSSNTQTAILLVSLHRVPPPKESMKGLFRESLLVVKLSNSSGLRHSSWVTAGSIVVVC